MQQKFVILVSTLCLSMVACKSSKKKTEAATDSSAVPATADATAATKPTKLGFVLGDVNRMGVNICLPLSIYATDDDRLTANVPAAATISLSSSAATSGFYSDENCVTAIKTATIPTGSQSVPLFFKDTAAGSPTLTFKETTANGLAQVSDTLQVLTVTKLGFSVTDFSATPADCSGFLFETLSADGTTIAIPAAKSFKIGSSSATGKFYSDETCTTVITTSNVDAMSAQSTTIYYKDSTAGTATITVSDAVASGGLTAATTNVTIAPATGG